LKRKAYEIGYPVLIKAVAGGGGKGMRRVDDPAQFMDALESCKREAASSFGDDRVLIEKYILSPRHIEVQVFGDSHGNVVHLFERDCSLQRRHQKVIEEAPAPGMDEETREAVCGAAVRAAKAVNYEGAGTIEFIADASEGLKADRIWFMEMNTRLQVEHPVTEEITGQDLVEWQLRVASGEKLPKTQDELSINGHAIEARLYAEDPAKGFLPSVGRLDWLAIGAGEGRVDTGVDQGGEVSSFYDPMIAKLVNSGGTRNEARKKLAAKLTNINVWPVRTNAGFLYRAVTNSDFAAAKIDTGFVERHLDELLPAQVPSEEALEAGLEALRWNADFDDDPPHVLGFRLNADPRLRAMVSVNGQSLETSVGYPTHTLRVDEPSKDRALVNEAGQTYSVTFNEPRGTGTTHGLHDGEIEAPMPGKVTAVEVAAGDRVEKGQRLLTLEAMKMEHALTAPFDGTVAELNAKAGAQVAEGQLLVKVEAAE